MYLTKLVNILKTLSQRELRKATSFLESPYFNENPKIVEFYKYLIQFHPNYEDEGIDRTVAFSHFFPNEPLNKKALPYLQSNLTLLLEEFLIQQKLETNKTQKSFLLLEAFEDKQLLKYYKQTLDKIQNHLAELQFRNIEYHQYQYDLLYHQGKYELDYANKKSGHCF